MTQRERIRAYAIEPIFATLFISLLVNWLGLDRNIDFMHSAARDLLSILLVLLGASLGLWIGIFWVSNTDFGRWLAERGELKPINDAFIWTCVTILMSSVMCVLCGFLSVEHRYIQLIGEWSTTYSLFSILTMLKNTRGLLDLHSLFVMIRNRTVTPITEPVQRNSANK